MGAIGGMLGTRGGAQGTGQQGPQSITLQTPLTPEQVAATNTGVTNSLGSQQALLQALQGQNGLGQQNAAGVPIQNLQNQLAMNSGVSNQNAIIGQGQTLANQLNAQNGVGNQSQALSQQQNLNSSLVGANGVGAQQDALAQQQRLNQSLAGGVRSQNAAISGLQGLTNQQQALMGQQQGTAEQYQNIANGTGPNPAQAALNQSTGQNVANQAALMAGQRGAGSNIGLLAREAAQQGAATQQQAVGQAATMQAQQQLAGLSGLAQQQAAIGATQNALGNTQQAIGGLGSTQAGMQQAGIGNQANIGSGLVGQQQTGIGQQAGIAANQIGALQNQQGILAGQAQNQIGNQFTGNQAAANQANAIANQQIAGTTANTAANQSAQQQALNAVAGLNSANVSQQGNVNQANAAITNAVIPGQQGLIGGLLNGAGAAIKTFLAEGGEVQKFAEGGISSEEVAPVAVNQPASSFAQFLKGFQSNQAPAPAANNEVAQINPNAVPASSKLNEGAANFGSALTNLAGAALAASGGKVIPKNEKEKAKVKGDSYTNDTVPALLSAGEIVLPRTVTQSKNPVRNSADFVAKVIAKRGKK